jgi:type I restriction enzyme, S subunit
MQYVFGSVYVSINDISINHDSERKPVTSGNRKAGEYPYYGASGIVDYVEDYIFDGDFLLVSEDGANLVARNTPIAFSISGKNWVNNHAHILEFDSYETRRYVEFYLNSIDLTSYITGGAQPKLNQQNLNKICIPLPSQERQKYIVSILDRFDELTADMADGIPAEIDARQKQYEYYRDKLLTFKEA